MPKLSSFVTQDSFDTTIQRLEKKMDKALEALDWLVGKYHGHDQEHELVAGKLADHDDRLETVEQKLSITP